MTDIVVTVPKSFGLTRWIAEGDPAGIHQWSGEEWHFYLWGMPPRIEPGERVYIVYNGVMRGYAPLVRIDFDQPIAPAFYPEHLRGRAYGLVRHGGAVAVTIPEYIRGFRGFRYRWWNRNQEVPFPNWQDPDARYPETSIVLPLEW